MIICHTIPGKDVDFMENDYHWHGIAPKPDEGERALEQLRKKEKEIRERLAELTVREPGF